MWEELNLPTGQRVAGLGVQLLQRSPYFSLGSTPVGAWGRQEEIEGMSWKLRGYQYSNRPAKKIHTVPSIQLRFWTTYVPG